MYMRPLICGSLVLPSIASTMLSSFSSMYTFAKTTVYPLIMPLRVETRIIDNTRINIIKFAGQGIKNLLKPTCNLHTLIYLIATHVTYVRICIHRYSFVDIDSITLAIAIYACNL